jgi:hypothetical protein
MSVIPATPVRKIAICAPRLKCRSRIRTKPAISGT